MKHETIRRAFLKVSAAVCAAPLAALGGRPVALAVRYDDDVATLLASVALA
jgi:hypothetical protein